VREVESVCFALLTPRQILYPLIFLPFHLVQEVLCNILIVFEKFITDVKCY
jgi:hypothetical protein